MMTITPTPLLSLVLNDCFCFMGEVDICLIVHIDDDYIYFYREYSDHLFKHKREHGVDVMYIADPPAR